MTLIADDKHRPRHYRLLAHNFLCVVAEGGVILDLRGNRYIGLSPSQMQALSLTVHGWPAHLGAATITDQTAQRVTEDFVRQGLLTEDLPAGKDAAPTQLPHPEACIVELDTSARPDHCLAHFRTLLTSCAHALLLLKGHSLEYAVKRVRKRKQRLPQSAEYFDLAAARTLMRIFYWLRPLLYTARDHCLFDSLALIEFLARYGLYPTWVIGVKTFAPFLAHSWVQYEGYTLNGEPDWLRAFAPVLAV